MTEEEEEDEGNAAIIHFSAPTASGALSHRAAVGFFDTVAFAHYWNIFQKKNCMKILIEMTEAFTSNTNEYSTEKNGTCKRRRWNNLI